MQPLDPMPRTKWAGPRRGPGRNSEGAEGGGQFRTEGSQRRAVTRRSAVEGRVSAVR